MHDCLSMLGRELIEQPSYSRKVKMETVATSIPRI